MALHPSRESYLGLPSATTILSSEVQPDKKMGTFSVTSLGIVMLLSEVQPEKAYFSTSVTDSGMMILSSEVQFKKAPYSIFVVPSGIMATPSLISNCAIGLFVLFSIFDYGYVGNGFLYC